MAPSIDQPDEFFDTEDIKRSDFGSKKSTDTTSSASQYISNIEKGNGEAADSPDPDELKSKVGSKKSITTVGSSTLAPTATLSSNVGSVSKGPVKMMSHAPLRKNTFRQASLFSLIDSRGSAMNFRRFERANAGRLLRLEAEIGELEEKLEQLEKEHADQSIQTSYEKKQKYRGHQDRIREMDKLGILLDMKLKKYYDIIFRSTRMRDLEAPVEETREREIIVRSLSAIFALLFLVTAIVVLYFINRPVARVGALSGFTIAFAIALISLTNAKRHEIFVATAAYAAVLVVFISGNLANTNYVNNSYYPFGPPEAAANTIGPIQTIVQVQTQTVTAGSEIIIATATATVTAIQTAVTSVYPTTCAPSTFCAATPSPSATSAAAKHGIQSLPLAGQAGVGVLLAIVGIISLSWLTSLLVGGFGCFVQLCSRE